MHNSQDLVDIFDQCFYQDYQTRLIGGAEEPMYTPGTTDICAYIYFTRDYFSSALHEAAHWLIAGEKRRELEDYGYWYQPDGRTAEQQRAFETVEVKPQALEWIFSACCHLEFRASADNLNGKANTSDKFKKAIHQQVILYLEQGLPNRASQFTRSLVRHYRKNQFPVIADFHLGRI